MGTKELIKEIQKLPAAKRMQVIKETLDFFRKSERKNKLQVAVDALMDDYKNDPNLTAFTIIDFDEFYEAR